MKLPPTNASATARQGPGAAAVPLPPGAPGVPAGARLGPRGEAAAAPPRREAPIIYAHRGDPTRHPELTLEGLRAALERGATGLEIDLTITKDGRIVLWHDYVPGGWDSAGMNAWAREAGFEGDVRFAPIQPESPVAALTLAELREQAGYKEKATGARAPHPIATLEEFIALAEREPRLRSVILDIKLPPDAPALQRRFAASLKAALEAAGLQDRALIMSNDQATLGTLRQVLGPAFDTALDHELPAVALRDDDRHADYQLVTAALREGRRTVSIGAPKLDLLAPLDAALDVAAGLVGAGGVAASRWDAYLAILRHNRQAIDDSGQPIKLVAWTINDRDQMADLLAIPVDGILTDRPELLAQVLAERARATHREKSPVARGLATLGGSALALVRVGPDLLGGLLRWVGLGRAAGWLAAGMDALTGRLERPR